MKKIAQFEINYLQYLDKDSQIVQAFPSFASDPKNLIPLYRHMVFIRSFDAKAVNLQRMGKLGTYPSALGQEAVGVGVASAMKNDDVFIPCYRDQAAMIIRGVKPSEILAYWGGDERGNNFAALAVREDFPISVPVGSQCLHAAGVAYALKYHHQQQRAAVCVCGDGGTSKGDFYEALNFSGVQQLPAVFVINNNQWAISVPRKLQSASATLAQKAIAAGIEGIQVDGNDVIAVYQAVFDALAKARAGKGSTVIEAVTYRLCDHTTADDAKRYIPEADLKKAWEYEPILRLRNYLMAQGVWTANDETELLKKCAADIDQAIQEYINLPKPKLNDMFDYLYEKLPAELEEQRAEAQKYA